MIIMIFGRLMFFILILIETTSHASENMGMPGNNIDRINQAGSIVGAAYCEKRNLLAFSRKHEGVQEDAPSSSEIILVDLNSKARKEVTVAKTFPLTNLSFNESCSKLVYPEGIKVYDIESNSAQDLIPFSNLSSLTSTPEDIRDIRLKWIDNERLLVQISQKSPHDLLHIFNTKTAHIEKTFIVDGQILGAEMDTSKHKIIVLKENKLDPASTPSLRTIKIQLIQLDLDDSNSNKIIFDANVVSLMDPVESETASLAVFENTIAFSIFSNSWETISGDQKVYLFSRSSGKIFATLDGFLPQKMSENILAFRKYDGTDEIQPHFYDFTKGFEQGFKSPYRYGEFSKTSSYAVFSSGLVSIFNSNLIQNKILRQNISGETDILYEGVDVSSGVNIKRIDSIEYEGMRLPAYLFSPSRKAVKGVVMYVHGGGPSSSMKFLTENFLPEFAELTKSGYAVLAVSYYNDVTAYSTLKSYEKKYRTVEIVSPVDELKDTESLLMARLFIDLKFKNLPVYLWGHSQGGHLVNFMATREADKAKWNGFISQAGPWTDKGVQGAPIDYVQNLRYPFLIAHGQKDISVKFSEAQTFVDEAKKYNKPFDFYFPVDEDHEFRHASNWGDWIAALLTFVEKNSGP
jgi:dienelactone hydrolase